MEKRAKARIAKKIKKAEGRQIAQAYLAEEIGWGKQPDPRIHLDTSNPCLTQELCGRCASLDLGALKTGSAPNQVIQVRDLSNVTGDSPCPLCRLFCVVRPATSWGGDTVFAYPSRVLYEYQYGPLGIDDPISLLAIPNASGWGSSLLPDPLRHTGYIMPFWDFQGPQAMHFRYIRPVGPQVDFDLIASWIKYCDRYHTGPCQASSRLGFPTAASHVIDCAKKKVIRISVPLKYLALSYVWGPPIKDDQTICANTGLPSNIPTIIRDAMIATLSLHYRYLWVDRYCIPQDSSDKKHRQISRMDVIYNQAEATLIAPASENAQQGMPGVNSTPRDTHPCAKLGDLYLFWSMSDPSHLITSSKWMTRGWTYQEGLLSRRLIFFTQQQVYFECNGMHHCEALRVPMWRSRPGTWMRYRNGAQVWRRRGIFQTDQYLTTTTLSRHLSEYRDRDLTYPSDSLNAFLGALKLYQKGQDPIFHFMGVPILPPVARFYSFGREGELKHIERRQRSIDGNFAAGLCWNSPWADFLPGRQRQLEFPSWSWAGWTHLQNTEAIEVTREYEFPYEMDPSISIQLKNGKLVDLVELTKSSQPKRLSFSHGLKIDTWAIRLRFKHFNDGELRPALHPDHVLNHVERPGNRYREIMQGMNKFWIELKSKDRTKAYAMPQMETLDISREVGESVLYVPSQSGQDHASFDCWGLMFENPFQKRLDRFWPNKHDFDGSFVLLVSSSPRSDSIRDQEIVERIGHVRAGLKMLHIPIGDNLRPSIMSRDEEFTQHMDWTRQTFSLG